MKGYIVGFLFTLGLTMPLNEQAEAPLEGWQITVLAVIWPATLGVIVGMELADTPPQTGEDT